MGQMKENLSVPGEKGMTDLSFLLVVPFGCY